MLGLKPCIGHLVNKIAAKNGGNPLLKSIHSPGELKPNPGHIYFMRFTSDQRSQSSDYIHNVHIHESFPEARVIDTDKHYWRLRRN